MVYIGPPLPPFNRGPYRIGGRWYGGGYTTPPDNFEKQVWIVTLVILLVVLSIIGYFVYQIVYDYNHPEIAQQEVQENYKLASNLVEASPECVVNSRSEKYSQLTIWCGDSRFTSTVSRNFLSRTPQGGTVKIETVDIMCRQSWTSCIRIKEE